MNMRVLLTGSEGFVGKNLRLHLSERRDVDLVCFNHSHSASDLPALLDGVDFVFHLAGVNRPQDPVEFTSGNVELTQALCDAIAAARRRAKRLPVVYASSAQAVNSTAYGTSKLAAEVVLSTAASAGSIQALVFRLPNVFGKWCKPNYNSVVATFCHSIARGLPIQISDTAANLTLVYVDDLVARFIELMDGAPLPSLAVNFLQVSPQYSTTLGELAAQILAFSTSRSTLVTERVGTGFARALYATYVSYLPVESFTYSIPHYADQRGVFAEMLKTPDCGQFSFFTAHPGVTRGGHYHHSKTEKFLVLKGQALFRFRHMQTGETHELSTSGDKSVIVETVPGWTHDITNTGSEEMLVMLWANEVFDRENPDTFACPVGVLNRKELLT